MMSRTAFFCDKILFVVIKVVFFISTFYLLLAHQVRKIFKSQKKKIAKKKNSLKSVFRIFSILRIFFGLYTQSQIMFLPALLYNTIHKKKNRQNCMKLSVEASSTWWHNLSNLIFSKPRPTGGLCTVTAELRTRQSFFSVSIWIPWILAAATHLC